MDIDRDAPVQAAAEIDISAPVDLVWSVQADLESWARWNPEVTSVSVRGPIRSGTAFEWKAGGMKVISELGEVDPPRRLGWSGRALGLRAVHVWSFVGDENGTRVRTEESFDGAAARLFRGLLKRKLGATLEQGVFALKEEAERRAAAVHRGGAEIREPNQEGVA
ncbi:MAG TPA: SRPBCC family protein [Longimicrobiales bacterium]|nr:SRPBCC family protein [Longimicrobiales bacterium]